MKKAKLDKEQWLAAYQQLERHGFITHVFDPERNDMKTRTTKAGLDVYKGVLALYNMDSFLDGPKLDKTEFNDEQLNTLGLELVKEGLMSKYYDSDTYEDKFALTHKGWELMTVYSECLNKNIVSTKSQMPSDKGVKLARGIMSFMKAMNKVGKMAQKFEKSSGGSPRFDTAGMSNYGNTKPSVTRKKKPIKKKPIKKSKYRYSKYKGGKSWV